ncbi:Ypt/Rab GTPase activating protein [Ceraceosorus bombacis]|uniref:Ypt/Rab GTPase activating protein n=1 Tax=Ceraceosorus bombacis TaxID=401625 RepID=A0A0P1BGL7_9BASI|nr:Ypt/Rab GTPase activating protein [Ceraceosorus bombacis]
MSSPAAQSSKEPTAQSELPPTASSSSSQITENRSPHSSGSTTAEDLSAWSKFFNRHAQLGRNRRHRNESDHKESMRKLRRLVLNRVPDDDLHTPFGPSRPLVWKLLLGVDCSATHYLDLVARGPSPAHVKIRNDTFRTLATDQGFKERVSEEMLIRLLEAFVWRSMDMYEDDAEASMEEDAPLSFSYVQGMNVLAAPFLYVYSAQSATLTSTSLSDPAAKGKQRKIGSEMEAFYCFAAFIERCCPLYVQPTLVGVHAGLELLDRCLNIADPSLFAHLRSKNLTAELYAFPSVLTLCACTAPLSEVLHLWDFLLAFGVHLNILCVVAQLLLMRDQLMDSASPMKLLRSFPPIKARAIIGITTTLVRDLPDEIYQELVAHTGAML